MMLRALAIACLTLAASSAAAQNRVGVAGAVNPDADLSRGGTERTVVIGQNVLFRDRIVTSGAGLVNVLFVDGSAFTVGPNARVVIDEFVYDPSTGAGSLVAEVTSGALRFVGGRLSKSAGGVRFNTPAGTLGVRGGITNIDLDPPCRQGGDCPSEVASFVFGEELSFAGRDGQRKSIRTEGYSFVVGDGRVDIVPTEELDLASLQSRLAGRRGTTGGADEGPTDAGVEQSGVPTLNSDLSPFFTLPRRKPVVLSSRYLPSDDPVTDGISLMDRVFEERGRADALRDFGDDAAEPPYYDPPPCLGDGCYYK